ncbi:helix-turn-helix domain-containing protein [Capnocytophaga leadbetteri]|jgi:hypothetical protein|uniref:helix-turn-helix domain-containing protein n=1 Tax=Capnocytophaga leadbetteri TaxID=327575 RepID=UPI0026EA3DB6|nr:helix-turn-helix transcriptional regulator [Capnocytophaga leadbetteri]
MDVEKVINKIVQERTRKGYSYENMAEELSLSVPAYRKLEIGETKLSVERLFQISMILEVPVEELLELNGERMVQNNYHNDAVYQQKIEHFYQENKEITEQLIKAKDELIRVKDTFIAELQREIEYLRKQQ